MSDDIIDLGHYLKRREEEEEAGGTFALWGADGERSRFALPLWRAIYLAMGERGGILWRKSGGGPLHPFVVLDLASDPPRREFPSPDTPPDGDGRSPFVSPASPRGMSIYLGEDGEGREWFLVLAGGAAGITEPQGRDREDVLFLAGECAGLLFLRGFAGEAS